MKMNLEIKIARLIAEHVAGFDLDDLYMNRDAYIDDGGKRYDVNNPTQKDIFDATQAIIELLNNGTYFNDTSER